MWHTTTDIFFTFPPAGPQTKGLVKSLDFPTQLFHLQTPTAFWPSMTTISTGFRRGWLGYEYWLLLAVMNVKRRNFTRIEFPRNHRHNNETFRIDKLFTFQQLLRMYKYSWTAAMFKWVQILQTCFWATASAAAWSRNTHGANHSPGSLQLYKHEPKSRVRQKQ